MNLRSEPLTTCEWAYIAGLLDGEGTIALEYHTNHKARPYANPYIGCSNKNLEALEFLRSRLGGRIIAFTPTLANASDAYKYTLHGRDNIKRVLEGIQPYSIIKRRHITLMLQFFNDLPVGQGVRKSNFEYELQLTYIEDFRTLNRKGRKEVTYEASTA